MQDAAPDLVAWKQKVHAVDMELRTLQTEAANKEQKRPAVRFTLRKPKLPFTRTSSPSPL